MSKKILIAVAFLLVLSPSHAQWEPDTRLTNSADTSRTSYTMQRCIAACGDTVHLTWSDKQGPSTDVKGVNKFGIFYMRSFDGGLTWENARRLTASPGISFSSSMSVSGSLIHIAWRDDRDGNQEIYYIRSTDGGETWGTETRLTSDPARSYVPGVAANGLSVHVVWVDMRPPGYYGIYYKRSDDGGLTWGADTRLTDSPSFTLNPSLAVSGENVFVAWDDNQDGNKEIYFKRSADGGQTWQPETRLTFNDGSSLCPSIIVSGPYVHCVWDNAMNGNTEILYRRSANYGLSWDSIKQLTDNPGSSTWAHVSAYGPSVHVAWEDDRDGNVGVYYKRSQDNGLTWGNDTCLNSFSFCSRGPNLAVAGQVVHAAWYDYRDFNYEIYYKRNSTGGITGANETSPAGSAGRIRVFPNPATTTLNVTFGAPGKEQAIVRLKAPNGKEVLMKEAGSVKGRNSLTLDLTGIPGGFYLLELAVGSSRLYKKIVVTK
jgi:hypothetical protein